MGIKEYRVARIRHPAILLLVSLILAAPSVLLVLQGHFGSIHFRIENFVFYRAIIVALILLAGSLFAWLFNRSHGIFCALYIFVFAIHVCAFSVLAYWFEAWHP